MKTKVQKVTATRINIRLTLSEARDLVDGLDNGFNFETSETATKLAELLSARLNKIDHKEETE